MVLAFARTTPVFRMQSGNYFSSAVRSVNDMVSSLVIAEPEK
jgi:hypothetical protein